MSERTYRTATAVELEGKLRALFKENKAIFEELVLRGWSISLSLPTDGMTLGYGYAPLSLSPDAGFVVSRSVTPPMVAEAIRADTGPREALR